jgi:hypothetical protein
MSQALPFILDPIRPLSAVAADFARFSHERGEDPATHFSLALTEDWGVVDAPVQSPTPEEPFALVATLRRAERPEAEIKVFAAHLYREVDPADWLLLYLKRRRDEVLEMRRLPSPTGEAGDALSLSAEAGRSRVSRSLAVKDGPRVFVVQCSVERASYLQVADEFFVAVSTFKLLNPTGQRYAEPMAIREVGAPLPCEFLFPGSWVEQPGEAAPPQVASFSLLNMRGETWAGQLTFAAIPRAFEPGQDGLVANYLGQLRENGIEVVEAELGRRPQPPAPFKGAWGAAYEASLEGVPLEVHCHVVEHARAWLLFALVGAHRDSDPEAHAINLRAFRVAVQTLTPAESQPG